MNVLPNFRIYIKLSLINFVKINFFTIVFKDFKPIQDKGGGGKKLPPPTSHFSPVTYTSVRISP